VIFADTHGELPETYEYNTYVQGQLAQAGIPFITVSAGSLEEALLTSGPTSANPTPPAYVLNPDGSRGRINRYRCSYDYKRRVVTRAVKALCGKPGAWKRSNVEQWLGYSVEEIGRCKPATECRCSHPRLRGGSPPRRRGVRAGDVPLFDTDNDATNGAAAAEVGGHRPNCDRCSCERFSPWQTNTYPLIDLGYRRADTIRWFTDNGHPTPARSACWFCPASSPDRWRSLRDRHPDLWERACTLDEHIRGGGGFTARGRQPFAGRMFLHPARIPLREVNLDAGRPRDWPTSAALPLFDNTAIGMDCHGGACFT
jgi:hypothetical protein